MTGDSQILLRHELSDSDDMTENDVDHETNRTFQHPWIDSKSQIRLLRLNTRGSKHASTRIEAHLEVCDVSGLPKTEYIALSYCWGEARTEQDIREIIVDNQTFAVRTNLSNFLRTEAVADLRIPIYIDAICLNQLDREERGCQVGVMSDVYRNASRTIVWLGMCPDEQESNLESLSEQLSDSDLRLGHWHSAPLIGLSFLCSRVYWRRLWIVQELLLSKSVELRCGRFFFDLGVIAGLVSLPRSHQFCNEPEDAGWWDNWKIARPRDFTEQSTLEDSIRDGWQWAVRLIHNRAKWLYRSENRVNATPDFSGLPFHEALMAFQHQQCRDRRDKVYALLGLLDEEGRSMMSPNYHCTLRALLTQAAATCVVSRWKSNSSTARDGSGNYEDRRFVEILRSMFALGSLDAETELSKATRVARSYMAEPRLCATTLTTEASDYECINANGGFSQSLSELECTHSTEVEVGNGLHIFEQVFQSFKEELSTAEVQEYASTDRKAFELSLATIQKKHRTMGAMRDMSRLRVFLQVMSAYEDLADSYLNVRNTVAYIWAAARFLLEVTHTLPDAFDAVLKSYHNLGESMPAWNLVNDLSGSEFEQRDLVAVLFHRLFGFHRLALHYFKKPAWQQLFNATWKHLEVQLSALIATLGEYKSLLQDRARTIELNESRQHITQTNSQLTQILLQTNQMRLRAEEDFRQLSSDEAIRRRGHVINWLAASDSPSDQDHGRAVRESCPGSGRWLLGDSRYRRWNGMETDEVPLLWVNAIPGAGKSVLASLVVDECSRIPNATVVFFYFKHDNPEKNSFVAMARSLLHQLWQQDETLLLHLFEVATKRGENVLRTTKLAKELLTTCLNSTSGVYAVIDGIDECPELEQKHIANFWIKHSEESRSRPNPCRCIMFSQDDASTRLLFASLPVIRICGESHKADIGTLCKSWGEKIRCKFNLNRQEVHFLVNETTSRAQGMFLFAHVVMENFHDQVNQADLFAELTSFPAELNEAYARVVTRVTSAKLPLSSNAKRLLSWVACVSRPLKWREIQVAVSIDSELRIVDLENRRFRVSLKQLCGALLEERPNGDIEFVHHSAEQYLLNQGYVDLYLEHCKMTELCLNYFALPAFSARCTESQLHDYAKAGTYGFLDYAMAWWIKHLENAIDTSQGKDLPGTLVRALETFFQQHWQEPRKRTKPTKRIEELCKSIANLEICRMVRETMSSMHFIMITNSAKLGSVETLNLFEALIRIRAAMESMPPYEELEKHYGSRLFKCPRVYCKWYSEGFSHAEERKAHIDKHERLYLCPHSSCINATVGFAAAKELSGHVEAKHGKIVTEEDFPAEQSDSPDHSRSTHEGPSSQTRPVGSANNNIQGPRSVPGEEQASNSRPADFAPKSREATESSQTGTQRHEEAGETEIYPIHGAQPGQRAKVVRDLQCSMCTKVFTRTSNLRSHLRTHSDDKPYQCSICGSGFRRQNDRKRHEKRHDKENFVFKEPVTFGGRG